MAPDISIIIEGYNESLDIGSAAETLAGLRAQNYPLSRVEVILAGSAAQVAEWRKLAASPEPFAAVRLVEAGGAHYYSLKNRGAEVASGELIAFLDSDVIPEPGWLPALAAALGAGKPASCGPSLFRKGPLSTSRRLALEVAASISWGFVAGPRGRAAGFLSHNLGFRRAEFERLRYRTGYGRTCAGSVLLQDMKRAGIEPELVPAQRVAHAFTWRWWCSKLHVRFGHEVYLLHRMNVDAVSRRAKWLGPLDALATPLWHVARDLPGWWRYSGVMGLPAARRLAGFALVLPLSLAARSGEMAGMLGTVFRPRFMSEFAARN